MQRLPILEAPGSEDAVGTWRRCDVDRPIDDSTDIFECAFGSESETPFRVSQAIIQQRGRVDILDAGCGTGNTAVTWARALRHENPSAVVGMTGLNDEDYTTESADPLTQEAMANGDVLFRLGKIAANDLAPGSFDVVHALEVIVHSAKPARDLRALLRLARPGGHVFATLGDDRSHWDSPFTTKRPSGWQADTFRVKALMYALKLRGHAVKCEVVEGAGGRYGRQRHALHIVKPSS